jgi:hypothetical protein
VLQIKEKLTQDQFFTQKVALSATILNKLTQDQFFKKKRQKCVKTVPKEHLNKLIQCQKCKKSQKCSKSAKSANAKSA